MRVYNDKIRPDENGDMNDDGTVRLVFAVKPKIFLKDDHGRPDIAFVKNTTTFLSEGNATDLVRLSCLNLTQMLKRSGNA